MGITIGSQAYIIRDRIKIQIALLHLSATEAESMARAKRALELWKIGRVFAILITCHDSKHPELILNISSFLNNETHGYCIIYEGGINTAGEIDTCIKYLEDPQRKSTIGTGGMPSGTKYRIYSVSSFYHLPRIYFLWLIRGKIVRLVASYQNISWKNLLLDLLKLIL